MPFPLEILLIHPEAEACAAFTAAVHGTAQRPGGSVTV